MAREGKMFIKSRRMLLCRRVCSHMPMAAYEFVALRGKKIEYGAYLNQIKRLKRNNDTREQCKT